MRPDPSIVMPTGLFSCALVAAPPSPHAEVDTEQAVPSPAIVVIVPPWLHRQLSRCRSGDAARAERPRAGDRRDRAGGIDETDALAGGLDDREPSVSARRDPQRARQFGRSRRASVASVAARTI